MGRELCLLPCILAMVAYLAGDIVFGLTNMNDDQLWLEWFVFGTVAIGVLLVIGVVVMWLIPERDD